jgi:hypothetical protein
VHLTPRPHGIAAIRRLHLDHVGAKPREQAAGEGTGEHLTELEHAQPVERAVRPGTSLPRSLPGSLVWSRLIRRRVIRDVIG